MKVATAAPDAERATLDVLIAAMGDVPASIGVPSSWTPTSPARLQVAWDGTPTVLGPVAIAATVRITAWSRSTTEAKALAAEAQGRLCAYSGDQVIFSIVALTGVLPARDESSGAQLASVTCRVTARSIPL